MGPSQADHPDHAVAIRAGDATGTAINQTVEPTARFGEPIIRPLGRHIEIGGQGERHVVLGDIGLILSRIELDVHSNLCSYKNRFRQEIRNR